MDGACRDQAGQEIILVKHEQYVISKMYPKKIALNTLVFLGFVFILINFRKIKVLFSYIIYYEFSTKNH